LHRRYVIKILRLTVGYLGFFLLSQSISGQVFFDRLSFKTGIANSTQCSGLSPFDHIKPPERSIQSVFFNLQYSQFINDYLDVTIGMQLIEKGFRVDYGFLVPNRFSKAAGYQYRFNYVELPANCVWHVGKYLFTGGALISYMYEQNYRFREIDVVYSPTKTATTFESTYSTSEAYSARFKKWDFGINLGVGRKIHKDFEIELTAQKHFVNVDNWQTRDIVYNYCFLFGIRYYFLSSK
jgi:hypothetical protein